MELLERDCQQIVRMAPADRPHHAVLSFTSLVSQLNNLADESPSVSSAFVLLERAELWCEQLDRVVQAASLDEHQQQVHAASRLSILLAKNRTYTSLRDVAGKEQQWQVALKYAKIANALDEEIADVVSTQAGGSTYTASDRLELARLQQTFGPTRIAKNQMNLCVLFSKIQRHNEASTYAASAISLIRAIISSSAKKTGGGLVLRTASNPSAAPSPALLASDDAASGPSASNSPARGGAGQTATAIPASHQGAEHDENNTPQALLAGALYNYGAQLEHITGRGREAQAAYNEALDIALAFLGKKHPLTHRLTAIVQRSTETVGASGGLPTVAPRGTSVFFVAKPPPSLPQAGDKRHQRASSQQGPRRPQVAPAAHGGSGHQARRPPTAPSVDNQQHTGRRLNALEPLDSVAIGSEALPPLLGHHRSQSSPSKPLPANTRTTVTAVAWDEGELPVARPKQRSDVTHEIDLVAAHQQTQQKDHLTDSASGSPARAAGLRGSQAAASSRSLKSGANTTAPSSPTRRTSSARRGSLKQREENVTQMIQERLAHWTEDVTGRLFSEYRQRYNAALRIQRAWKCSQCRLETYNRRQIFYHHLYVQQVGAVQAITSTFRTLLAKKHRLAAVERQRADQLERVEQERRRNRSATIINRNVRLYLIRKHKTQSLMRLLQLQQEEKLKQYDVAAVLVQRWWRIVRVQKTYWRKRQAEYAEELRLKTEREKLGRAATEIQRIVRGLLGRRYFAQFKIRRLQEIKEYKRKVKESTVLVRTFLRELQLRLVRQRHEKELELSRRHSAVIAEQTSWEDALRRRAIAEAKRQSIRVTESALTIQRFVRQVRSRRELKYRKTVQRATNSLRIDKEFRERRAAIRLQCFARVLFAKQAVRKVKASFGRRLLLATKLVQRAARGYQERTMIGPVYQLARKMTLDAIACARERKAMLVTRIQAFVRSLMSTRAAVQLHDAIEAEEQYVVKRYLHERREDEAAAKIQSLARMRIDKNRVDALRREMLRQQQLALRAVCCIQRFTRQLLARRALHQRRRDRERKHAQLVAAAQLQHELHVMRAMEFDTICELEFLQILNTEEQQWSSIRQSFFISSRSDLRSADSGATSAHHHGPVRNDDDEGGTGPGIYDAE